MKGTKRTSPSSFSSADDSGTPPGPVGKAGGKGFKPGPVGTAGAVATTGSVRVLVHMCCGPCSIYPIRSILKERAQVFGFFHNPNIHPYSEFKLRLAAVKKLAGLLDLDVLYDEEYRPTAFIKGMKRSLPPEWRGGKPPEGPRCSYCYSERLEATARAAKAHRFDAFSSSLLYSRYANHDEIKELGLGLADRYGRKF